MLNLFTLEVVVILPFPKSWLPVGFQLDFSFSGHEKVKTKLSHKDYFLRPV